MNFKELAAKRYSVRNYSSKPVEKKKIDAILETVRLAPSAVNFQPWKMIVVIETAILKKLHEVYPRDWFMAAPVCFVVLGDHERGWHRQIDKKDHTDIDVAIAIDHLTLAAAEAGLGTCWICSFDPDKISNIFNLPENIEPIAMIPMGYLVDEKIPDRKRKTVEQLFSWNGFD